jgi:uncharacterized membrane protein
MKPTSSSANGQNAVSHPSRSKRIGVGFVFLGFFVGSGAHLAATDVEMRIVPPCIPWPRAAVPGSGVFELLGAVGLWWPATRRAAGIGLFLPTLAVTAAHIPMLQASHNRALFIRYAQQHGGDSAAARALMEAELARQPLKPTRTFSVGTGVPVAFDQVRDRHHREIDDRDATGCEKTDADIQRSPRPPVGRP